MVIHAIYKDGVFRPLDSVQLPDDCKVDLMVQPSKPEQSNASATDPLAGIASIASQFPENADLPSDLARQHDHYLYGSPKRP